MKKASKKSLEAEREIIIEYEGKEILNRDVIENAIMALIDCAMKEEVKGGKFSAEKEDN